MNYVWTILILLGATTGVNLILSFYQQRDLARTYVAMRREHPLVIGKCKRLLSSGCIAMFGIDSDGRIHDARLMRGYSVLARFRQEPRFLGKNAAHLDKADMSGWPAPVRRAVANASQNYLTHLTGGTPSDPEGPWARLVPRSSHHKNRHKEV